MSFPHRTWFYDRQENEIIHPEQGYLHTAPTGETWREDVWMTSWGSPISSATHERKNIPSRLIPLASTGLEDCEGNEIIEGHILQQKGYLVKTVVNFVDGKFVSADMMNEAELYKANDYVEIVGHTLTDPEKAPDGFDPAEYFGLEDDEDAEHR